MIDRIRFERNTSRISLAIIALICYLAVLPILSKGPASAGPAGSTPEPSNSVRPAPAVAHGGAPNSLGRRSVFSPMSGSVTATKADALLNDVNGDGNADPGDRIRYTVTISASGMDATGVSFNDTIDPNTTLVPGTLAANPIASNDSYSVLGNVQISVAAPGLLANDFVGIASGSITSFQATSAQGGNVSVTTSGANAGAFTYNPAPGFEGTDTFTYTITNPSGTDTATVTLSVSGMIWFVDSSAATNGDGRLTSPFNTLTGAGGFSATAADDPGDNIFLYSGSYAGGLALQNNQKLIGQGAGATLATVAGVTVPPDSLALPATGGTRPVVSDSANNVTLASGNTIRGLDLSNTGATALVGNSFGNLSVAEVSVSNTGGVAISLDTGNPTAAFTSVSASGAANGIFLKNTTGSLSSAGGTIQNTTGADSTSAGVGIYLENAQGVSFSNMQINDHTNFAIRGIGVNGFTLSNTTVSGANGNNASLDEGSVVFDGLFGTCSISNSTISGGHEDNVNIDNSAGTLNLSVTGSTFRDNHNTLGNDGLFIEADTTANVTVSVTGSTFTRNKGDHFQFSALGNATAAVTFTGNVLSGGHPTGLLQGIGIDAATFNGTLNYNISNNNMTGTLAGGAIRIVKSSGTGTFSGTVSGNTIGDPAISESGAASSSGIRIENNGAGTHTSLVTNNLVRQYDQGGIDLVVGQVSNSTLNATVTGNTISNPGPNAINGILVNAGTAVGQTNVLACTDINNNTTGGSGVTPNTDIRLRQRNLSTVRLPGYAGGSGDTTAVQNFIAGQNTGSETVNAAVSGLVGSGGFVGGAACAQPSAFSVDDVAAASLRAAPTSDEVSAGTPDYTDILFARQAAAADSGAIVTSDEVYSIFRAAIERHRGLGLSSAEVARLEGLEIQLAKLPDDQLMVTTPTRIILDFTAAGYGWFVDRTPFDDSEFALTVGGARRAGESSEASGRLDLLTAMTRAVTYVIEHEWAHKSNNEHILVDYSLSTSTRRVLLNSISRPRLIQQPIRVPAKGGLVSQTSDRQTMRQAERDWQVGDLVADPSLAISDRFAAVRAGFNGSRRARPAMMRASIAAAPMSGETVSVNIGNLQAGKTVTIIFDVDVNSPLSDSVCKVSNQGTVSWNGGSVLTDDPSVGGTSDATETPIVRPPDVTCPSDQTATENPPGSGSATVNYTTPTANCATVACVPPSGSSFSIGTTQVTCTATNSAGQTDSCTFNVTVTPACTLTCSPNIVQNNDPGQCGAVVTFADPSGSGNCTSASCSPTSGSPFPKGTTTVTCSTAGGSSCTFTVTIQDTEAPVISGCNNVSASTSSSSCDAAVTYTTPTATDNCDGARPVSCTPASGSTFSKGTTTVTCTASDANTPTANTSTCTFTVTVTDDVAPVVSGCNNVAANTAANSCNAAVTYTLPTANDNCDGARTVTCTPPSGDTFAKGVTTVTCSASDTSNNTGSCTFTVTVTDNVAPVLAGCNNVSAYTSSSSCDAVVTYTKPTANDNCDGARTVTCMPDSGSTFPKGTTTVTCNASDTSGNTGSCTFTVTVTDNVAPVVSGCTNLTANSTSSDCKATVVYPVITATDNCDGARPVTCVPPSGSVFSAGTTTVTCSATDTSGNTGMCTFTVTVTNPAPVVTITGPPSGSLYEVGTAVSFTGSFTDNTGTHTATWTFTSNSTTITQAGTVNESTGAVSASYTFTQAGVYLVTLTVSDGCGGTGSATLVNNDLTAMVVIYDPDGGFVTGGGWINSPAGAYTPNPALTGKASFGFVSKYKPGRSTPDGNTEFQFRAANFNFKSTEYDFMVISGARVTLKGTGTVNGQGDYEFLMQLVDGQVNGGGGADKFRIRIKDKNNNNQVIYDNEITHGENDTPTTLLGGGSIVIHNNN